MLPASHRLTDSESFRIAVRRGHRAGSKRLVVHLLLAEGDEAARVGLVVSRAVGPAVVRNRVKRRLRHLARESLRELPGSAVLVVRALPAAGSSSYADLGHDLTRSLQRVLTAQGPQGAWVR